MVMTQFDEDFATYNAQLPDMVRVHRGQYVVIKNARLEHFSETYESALEWAYDRFGLDRFFVKRVSEDCDVAHFTRDLGPCRP